MEQQKSVQGKLVSMSGSLENGMPEITGETGMIVQFKKRETLVGVE